MLPRIRNDYGEIGVFLGIQSESGEIRARKTPNTNTFYAVFIIKEKALRKTFKLFVYF